MRRPLLVCLALAGVLLACTSADRDEVDVLATVLAEHPTTAPAGTDRELELDRSDDGGGVDGDALADAPAEEPGGDAPASSAVEAALDRAGASAPSDLPPSDTAARRTPAPSTPAPPTSAPDTSAPRAAPAGPTDPSAAAPDDREPPSAARPRTPPAPRAQVLGATERTATGEVRSVDGQWVVSSSRTIEAGDAPDPITVEARSTSRGADEELTCAVTLAAPGDRALVVRGEVVVSVATTTAEGTRREPAATMPVDLRLEPGDAHELSVAPVLLSHGAQDATTTCIVAFAP